MNNEVKFDPNLDPVDENGVPLSLPSKSLFGLSKVVHQAKPGEQCFVPSGKRITTVDGIEELQTYDASLHMEVTESAQLV